MTRTMQPDTIPTPHGWQLVYIALASIVTSVGTLIADRIIKRKREPAEIRKIEAETHSIHTSSDISFGGLTLETFREIQTVIQKAEDRRAEWHLKEEQMRTQILFWRNKAEELDGRLIDSCDANVQLNARLKVKRTGLEKAAALIHYHGISFSEADLPEVKQFIDIIRAHRAELDHEKE